MRVAQVWRYPVKSMQGERLDALVIDGDRVLGDRVCGVRDSTTGKMLTGRMTRPLLHARSRLLADDTVRIALPDGRELDEHDDATDLALSSYLGTPVHLARAKPTEVDVFEAPRLFDDDSSEHSRWPSQEGTFNDGHPVHLLSTASLRGGAKLHDADWDVRRFRPNLLVETDGDDFPEDGWTTVQIGTVVLEIYKQTTRCALTARAQPGIDDDLGVPRALARSRKAKIGVYARVQSAGTIDVGADVRVT